MDGTLQLVLHEHWFNFFKGENTFFETNFYFPAKNTLGYSDVFLIQGPIHSLLRFVGFNLDLSWTLTTFIILIIGNIGWYLVSKIILNKNSFRIIFVILMSLNYTLVAYISSQPNSASYSLFSYFIYIVLKINQNLKNNYVLNLYIYLFSLFFGLILLSNWYLTFFILLLMITIIFITFLTNKNLIKNYILILSKNIEIKNYLINFFIITPFFILFLLIYLPVVNDPIRSKTDLLNRSQSLKDLFNGAYPDDGGIFVIIYKIFNFNSTLDFSIGIGLISGIIFILLNFNLFKKIIYNRKPIETSNIILLSTFIIYIFFLEIIPGFSIFSIFYDLIPGLNSIRDTFRFNIILNYIFILYLITLLEKIYVSTKNNWSKIAVIMIISIVFIDQFRFPIKGWNPNVTVNLGLESQAKEIKSKCDYLYFDAPGGWWYDQAVAMRFSQVHGIPTINGNSGGWPNNYPYMDFAYDGDISEIILWMDGIKNKVGCFSNGELPIFATDAELPRVHFEGGFTPIETNNNFQWQWSISNKAYALLFSPNGKDLQIQFDAQTSKCNENSILQIKNYFDGSLNKIKLNSSKSKVSLHVDMKSKKFNKLELKFDGQFCNIGSDPRDLFYQLSNLEYFAWSEKIN